ncbi:MAG TPA: hypothetical protein VJU86_06405 [Pyrinomonadaceae bacterium]|nr:hypothetical protein [Pyrinomonadaceae bacterium]
MRQFSLNAICLALTLCGTVSPQQALVEVEEKDNPCARFKMRILVPGNHVDFKLRVKKPTDGIDSRMVWNPCPGPEPQFAFAPDEWSPDRPGGFLVQRSFGFQPSTVTSGKQRRPEFQFRQLPSPFDK